MEEKFNQCFQNFYFIYKSEDLNELCMSFEWRFELCMCGILLCEICIWS